MADVVYGSRFTSGGARRVLYYWHSVGNRLLTMASNMSTNINLTDMETGSKAFRKEVLDPMTIQEDRFGFEPEVTAKVAAGGWRVCEVGITYQGRTYAEGKKTGWRDGVVAAGCIARYGTAERVRRRRSARLRADTVAAQLGPSLAALEGAENYYDWIASLVAPSLRGHVLEVGAGTGTVTKRLVQQGFRVTCVEPDQETREALAGRLAGTDRVTVLGGFASDLTEEHRGRYDSALLVNVIEHIEDDRGELQRLALLLPPGSPIVIWVPAFDLLYSRYDREVGHYRRYSRRAIEALCESAGLAVASSEFVNAPGAVAWAVAAKALRLRPASGPLTRIYDSRFVPTIRAVESGRRVPFGQSLLVCAVTPGRALIARRISSAVAGTVNGGSTRCPPTALMASRIARNTEKHSSSGGSPTALLRWIVSAVFGDSNSSVRRSGGTSFAVGTLYDVGAHVSSWPVRSSQRRSSIVIQPRPWT